jgi:2,4-dienoyl-CoA reductase-like NADH-dependent reductase (Old Yellow Enzyme family)
LGALALSGAGLMCVEGTAVEAEGRITPGDLGLWDDRTEAAFRAVLTVVRKHSKIPVAIQLAHAGAQRLQSHPLGGRSADSHLRGRLADARAVRAGAETRRGETYGA